MPYPLTFNSQHWRPRRVFTRREILRRKIRVNRGQQIALITVVSYAAYMLWIPGIMNEWVGLVFQ